MRNQGVPFELSPRKLVLTMIFIKNKGREHQNGLVGRLSYTSGRDRKQVIAALSTSVIAECHKDISMSKFSEERWLYLSLTLSH
jgi:hypothetical protein